MAEPTPTTGTVEDDVGTLEYRFGRLLTQLSEITGVVIPATSSGPYETVLVRALRGLLVEKDALTKAIGDAASSDAAGYAAEIKALKSSKPAAVEMRTAGTVEYCAVCHAPLEEFQDAGCMAKTHTQETLCPLRSPKVSP